MFGLLALLQVEHTCKSTILQLWVKKITPSNNGRGHPIKPLQNENYYPGVVSAA
jgi:hypothetical protein